MTQFFEHSEDLARRIPDQSSLCLAPDYSGCSISTILELIRQQRRNLHIIGVPQIGLQADLLIGAGCVTSIDAASVTLGEFGQAPRFVDAVTNGSLTMQDSTCPVLHAGLQAAEKGIPFMPLRGILGSDLVRFRDDWKVIDNPFSAARTDNARTDNASTDNASTDNANTDNEDPILLVPAINTDVTLFHAPKADKAGNVWIGTRRELMLMAHASKQVIVTVEKIVSENLMADATTAAGVIPALYIDALAEMPKAADPVGLFGCYEGNQEELSAYVEAAATQQGFDEHVQRMLGAIDKRKAARHG